MPCLKKIDRNCFFFLKLLGEPVDCTKMVSRDRLGVFPGVYPDYVLIGCLMHKSVRRRLLQPTGDKESYYKRGLVNTCAAFSVKCLTVVLFAPIKNQRQNFVTTIGGSVFLCPPKSPFTQPISISCHIPFTNDSMSVS